MDIEKILVSNEFTYGKDKELDATCFIGYKSGKTKVRQLSIELPQISGFVNKFAKS